jgi:hypothetical protein
MIPTCLIVTGLVAWAAPGEEPGQTGAASPEEAVRGFADALNAIDLPKAATFVDGAPEPKEFEDLVKALEDARLQLRVTTVRVTRSRERATARFGLVVTRAGQATARENLNVAAELVANEDRWFLVAPPLDEPADPFNRWAATLRAGPEGVRRARIEAQSAQSLANIRQLAAATLRFARENGGRLALNQGNWRERIQEFVEDEAAFKSPGDRAAGPSYTFNPGLANRTLASIRIRQRTVLLFEGRGNRVDYRWDGRAAVAFVDGGVMLISQDDARRILWR